MDSRAFDHPCEEHVANPEKVDLFWNEHNEWAKTSHRGHLTGAHEHINAHATLAIEVIDVDTGTAKSDLLLQQYDGRRWQLEGQYKLTECQAGCEQTESRGDDSDLEAIIGPNGPEQ